MAECITFGNMALLLVHLRISESSDDLGQIYIHSREIVVLKKWLDSLGKLHKRSVEINKVGSFCTDPLCSRDQGQMRGYGCERVLIAKLFDCSLSW